MNEIGVGLYACYKSGDFGNTLSERSPVGTPSMRGAVEYDTRGGERDLSDLLGEIKF